MSSWPLASACSLMGPRARGGFIAYVGVCVRCVCGVCAVCVQCVCGSGGFSEDASLQLFDCQRVKAKRCADVSIKEMMK